MVPIDALAPGPTAEGWLVRPASPGDAPAVGTAVAELLRELGAVPPGTADLEGAASALIAEPDSGMVLVAVGDEPNDPLLGVLAVSWPLAIHACGRYGLIQDLWVDPGARGRAIGRALLDALAEHAARRGVTRLEVGIPRDTFPGLAATRQFYLNNDFDPLGGRLRRALR